MRDLVDNCPEAESDCGAYWREHAAMQREIDELRQAVRELAALIAWQNFGDCRAWTTGPILRPHEADELARKVLMPNVEVTVSPKASPVD